MLNTITSAINTKLLIAILAALGTIAALLVHQQHEAEKTAVAAAQAAAILKQQQDAEQKRQKAYAEFTEKVNAEKRKNSKMPADQGKTWRTYLP